MQKALKRNLLLLPSGCEKTIEIEKMLIGNQPVMQLRRLKNGVFSQTAVNYPNDIYVADIDMDGDLDAIAASSFDDKITWFENEDGKGRFGHQKVISKEIQGANTVIAADIDGDNDLDVLAGSPVSWFENQDGLGNFGALNLVPSTLDGASSISCADVDGDIHLDVIVVSNNSSALAWYKNTDGLGSFTSEVIVDDQIFGPKAVHVTDVDGDNDNDILVASFGGIQFSWYENLDGAGNFGPRITISENMNYGSSISSGDLDGDGDQDVIVSAYGAAEIVWFENMDGMGSFQVGQGLFYDLNNSATDVTVADVDLDGDLDVMASCEGENNIIWFENADGNGYFSSFKVITFFGEPNPREITIGDVDNDGDLDVFCASSNQNTTKED